MWTCRPLLLRTFECTLRWAAQPRRLASWGFFKVRLQCLGFLSFSAWFLLLLFFLCFCHYHQTQFFAAHACGQQLLPAIVAAAIIFACTVHIQQRVYVLRFQSLNCSAIIISAKQFITLSKCLQKSERNFTYNSLVFVFILNWSHFKTCFVLFYG